MLRSLTFAAFLFTALPAQTFVVDSAGGPGSNFTDLQSAVQTVPDGSVLRVRAGTYGAIDVVGKGVAILCDPGVLIVQPFTLTPPVRVFGLPATSSFTLQGVSFLFISPVQMIFDQCQGHVLLDDITADFALPSTFTVCVLLRNCAQVTLRDSTLGGRPAVDMTDSSVVVEGCWIQGKFAELTHGPVDAAPGIRCNGGQLVIGRSTVTGGDGVAYPSGLNYPPASAMVAVDTALRIHDDGTGSFSAGTGILSLSVMVPAIGGTRGSLVLDPAVRLVSFGGGPVVTPAIPTTIAALPSLRSIDAPISGTVSVEVFSPVGDDVFLFVALPGPTLSFPVFGGDTWIDPASLSLVRAGTQPATQDFGIQVPVPNTPLLEGARFIWQALGGSLARGHRLSNPSIYVHR